MGLEGEHHRFAAEAPRALYDRIDDRPVTEVQAVEVADGQHRPNERAIDRVDPSEITQC
jgi:hypothetical protein